jgi:hypothetical protein
MAETDNMNRRPTTQDITWILDLARHKQLDINPPYQRRSVWTMKDKQFFLDTIFRNYPCPAIFLHKEISDNGFTTYHVVDGKQRTQTILEFVNDQLRIAKDFGDLRLDGKKWSDLQGEPELKKLFWNYQITIEQIDFPEGRIVNEVFDRLNRNARRLTNQELRHAKFEGWFINEVEAEAARDEWRLLGVVTNARAKRMADSQFISELALVILEKQIFGFDQDGLDEIYGKYDDPQESVPSLNVDEFRKRFAEVRNYLLGMESSNGAISMHARTLANVYSIWSLVALSPAVLPIAADLAARYTEFMSRVAELSAQTDLAAFLTSDKDGLYKLPFAYFTNAGGASTDLAPRRERHSALTTALLPPAP